MSVSRWSNAIAVALCLTPVVTGEMVELIDGTKMAAKLVHYYDGLFTFEAAGQVTKVSQDKIRSITFALPAPRPTFSSPRKAFDEWRAAVQSRDVKRMIECYALVYQAMALKQFESLSGKDRDAMWAQAQGMRLKWLDVEIKGEKATAKIRASHGKETGEGELNFARENGEWKMTPMPFGLGGGGK